MRRLDELNINECGRPLARLPPTDGQISNFESHFGVVLPEDYVSFLRHSNGGHPEKDSFRPKGLVEDFLWGISRFYYLVDDRNDLGGLWGAALEWRRVISGNIVPIGNFGGGDQLLLSFEHGPPTVKICIHDENMRLIHAADSFGELIDMLTDDPEMI